MQDYHAAPRAGRLRLKKMQLRRVFAVALAAALAGAAAPSAPPTPPTPPAADARAFLALPEPDRKAAQDALGWLGFYNGVDDGAYGKRTIDAFKAYQQKAGETADGVLTGKTLAALKDGAAKAKAAVGFAVIDDAATGVRIGAPMKLLEKRASAAGAAALTSKDGAVDLSLKAVQGDLATLYKTMSADAGARKVTYEFLKAGAFFVTAGEEGDMKFYRRYAADGDKLRGFAFIYPKKRAKALDPVALAIANSFDPFPAPPPAPVASATPTPTPEPPRLTATALIVAPGVAVTALDPARCPAPEIAGKPARFLPPQGALARLGGDFGAGAAPPPVADGGGDLVALSLVTEGASLVLQAAPVQTLGHGQAMAALEPSASGAPLFDRRGRLVAFVAAIAEVPRRAGVALSVPHPTLAAADLGGPDAADAGATLTAAEIANLRRAAIVGVFCAP